MTPSASETERTASSPNLEVLKFDLERARYRTELLKWIVVAIGAIVSFYIIDYGKLKLEQFRVKADNQRQLLEAYLRATESPQPDVWKRKLHILTNFADDDQIRQWAHAELKYIQDFAGRDVLYRETLKVASQLVDPDRLNSPERVQARVRYNQLYWADLPYVRESSAVESAMVEFRRRLLVAEWAPADKQAWNDLDLALIGLSKALRDSTPSYPLQPAPAPGAAEPQR
jgi:hypothetical protein